MCIDRERVIQALNGVVIAAKLEVYLRLFDRRDCIRCIDLQHAIVILKRRCPIVATYVVAREIEICDFIFRVGLYRILQQS